MTKESKQLNTYFSGIAISSSIFLSMFIILEWMQKIFRSGENGNPLMLPKLHLLSLAVNIILFRYFIKKGGENTAKGILLVSFLYILIFFYVFYTPHYS